MAVTRIAPSFNVPIRHLNADHKTGQRGKKCADFIDDYFSWSRTCYVQTANDKRHFNGKIVQILRKETYRRGAGNYIFKIFSYLTLIIPIVMLFAKLIYRAQIKNDFLIKTPQNQGLPKKVPDLKSLPKVDDHKPVIEECKMNRQTILITCYLPALRWRPEEALMAIDNILKHRPQPFPNKLDIKFTGAGANAYDAGGLSRQFISILFASLLKSEKGKALHFNKCDATGYVLPEFNDKNPGECREHYEALGRLLIFLLNCRTPHQNIDGFEADPPISYPIGELFDPAFFRHLQTPLADPTSTAQLPLAYFDLMNAQERGKRDATHGDRWILNAIESIRNESRPWNALYPWQQVQIQKAVSELNQIWFDERLDPPIDATNYYGIRDAFLENAQEPMVKKLLAMQHVQKGMLSCLPQNLLIYQNHQIRHVRTIADLHNQFDPEGLRLAIQGQLTKNYLKQMLRTETHYNTYKTTHPGSVRAWLCEWIDHPTTTLEMLRIFVKALTGAPSLTEEIMIQTTDPSDKNCPEVKPDTCKKVLFVNELLTKKTFMQALEAIIEDNDPDRYATT